MKANKSSKAPKLAKVTSLNDLFNKAKTDDRYAQLALISASNLGGAINATPTWKANSAERVSVLRQASQWFDINASETGERGVIGEINFCLDLV